MAQLNLTNTTWNLSLLAKDEAELKENQQLVEKKSYEFINKWKDNEDYLNNPEVMAEALKEYEEWMSKYANGGNASYYYWLKSELDQNDTEVKAKMNKCDELDLKIINDIAFFTHRISLIPLVDQEKFLNYEPLKEYKHFLETHFAEAKYLLSEAEEKILALKSPTSYSNWVKMTSTFLSKEEREIINANGKKEIKNFSEIMSLLDNSNKAVRDSAAVAFNDILLKYAEVGEHEFNSILANKKVDDELRKIERPDMVRHISDDIETEVVDTLVEVVTSRFDIAHRYYELKSKLLGLPKLEYHERNIEYGTVQKEYTWEESIQLVHKVMNNLDPKFGEVAENFVKNGNVDVFPKKGKTSGAFCVHVLITQPIYVLLNFTGKLNDVTTIAHEFGHGINDQLMIENQNALNAGSPLSTAECASTFMEDFVLQEILKTANDEEKLSILMTKLNGDIGAIIRSIGSYNFEKELHSTFREKGFLSKDEIGNLFQKHMSSYMGDFVEMSAGSENWWVYWGHLRRFFYNYSYANGLLISKSLQASVKRDPKFVEKVKGFLSAGMSDSPKNIFSKMGVDITSRKFWNDGMDEVENLLKETEELAKKLGKIK